MNDDKRGAKAHSSLDGATHSLPALHLHTRSASSVAAPGRGYFYEPLSSSRASGGRSSVHGGGGGGGGVASSVLTPIQRQALNDAPFLVKDKVKAMEQFAVMAAPRRPGARGGPMDSNRSKVVPLPVTVVGMQSSGVTNQPPKPPSPNSGGQFYTTSPRSSALLGFANGGIDPEVHEAIIAQTVAKLASVFQHRLQEHAIAATVRHFTKDLLAPEAASRISRPHTILDIKGANNNSTPYPPQHAQSARLPTLQGYDAVAAIERAIQNPPSSSLLCRTASPSVILKSKGENGALLNSPRRLVPVQPNMSSTTPSRKDRDASTAVDKSTLLRHPAIVAPWVTAGREPQIKVLGEPTSTLTANLLLHQQRLLAAEADDGDHVPLAEAALNRILLGGHVVDDVEGFVAPPSSSPPPLQSAAVLHQQSVGPIAILHASPTEAVFVQPTKVTSTKRLARKGPATSGPSRQGGASSSGGLLASHDLAMAIAQLLGDDEEGGQLVPQLMVTPAKTAVHDNDIPIVAGGASPQFDFHSGAHLLGAAPRIQRNRTPNTTTSPRSSEVVDHIMYDPVLQRWVSATRDVYSGVHDQQQQGKTGVFRGGVDDAMIPQLVVGSDMIPAAAATTGHRNHVKHHNNAGGRNADLLMDGAELHGSSALDKLLVSPFSKSARVTPSLEGLGSRNQPPNSHEGTLLHHGYGSGSKKHGHHPPVSPLVAGPRSPLFQRPDGDDEDAVLSPLLVEKKSVFANSEKRRANAQKPVGHDNSALLHFDESFGREQDAALREAAAAAAEKEAQKDKLKLLRNATRAAMLMLNQSAAGGIPQSVKELVPVPMNAEISPHASATSPRLLSADQATLEAQVERDVIQSGYDNILGPAREVKSKVEASAELLQQAIGLKLQYREQLVKKYDALQTVKSSHSEVMQTMTALHNCIAAGKENIEHISLDTLMASINTLTSMDERESGHHGVGGGAAGSSGAAGNNGAGGSGVGQRKSVGGFGGARQSMSDSSGTAAGAGGGAPSLARTNTVVGRRSSTSTTLVKGNQGSLRRKNTASSSSGAKGGGGGVGGGDYSGVVTDSSAYSSGSDSSDEEDGNERSGTHDDSGGGGGGKKRQKSHIGKTSNSKASGGKASSSGEGGGGGASKNNSSDKTGKGGKPSVGKGSNNANVGGGRRQQQDVSFANSDEDPATPSRSNNFSGGTAELLRQAQRAKSTTSPANAMAASGTSSAMMSSFRPRNRGDEDSRHSNASEAAPPPPLPPPHAVLIMRKAFLKASLTFKESKNRFDHSQAVMTHRGRILLKKPGDSSTSNLSGSSNISTPASTTTKRVPAALEARLATATTTAGDGGLSAAEEKEFISAAISDELQAEFRDITARRDSQRGLAERQEKELEDLRLDMKRLTSGTESSRDETAAQLTSLIHRRDKNAAEEKARTSQALLGYPVSGTDSPAAATGEEEDNDEGGDDDDIRGLVEGRQQVGFVETAHAAVQVDEDQLPQTSAQQTNSAEQANQLEDLFRLERILLQSVRRLMVAVAHVMLFHDAISIELTCKKCLNIFTAPQMLWPCGHVFCHDCLQSMYDTTSELLTCGECGTLADIGFTPEPVLQNLGFYQNQFRVYAGGGAAAGKKGKPQQHASSYNHQRETTSHARSSPQSVYNGSFDAPVMDHNDDAMSRYSSSSISVSTSSPTAKASSGSPVRHNASSFDKPHHSHNHHHHKPPPASLPEVLRELLRDLGGTDETSRSASPNAVGGSFSFGSPHNASIEL